MIQDVKDLYSAVIKMIDSGDKLKVDQTHVETVIPGLGKDICTHKCFRFLDVCYFNKKFQMLKCILM